MPPASREKSSDPRNKYRDNSNPPSPKSPAPPPAAFNSSNGLSGNGSVGGLSPDCISVTPRRSSHRRGLNRAPSLRPDQIGNHVKSRNGTRSQCVWCVCAERGRFNLAGDGKFWGWVYFGLIVKTFSAMDLKSSIIWWKNLGTHCTQTKFRFFMYFFAIQLCFFSTI